MSDKALQNALRHRDDLASQINKAQQQIEEWRRAAAETDAFIAAWRRFAGEDAGPPPPPPPPPPPVVDEETPAPRRRKATKNSKKEDVADEAYQMIDQAGRPLSRTELFDRLTAAGMVIEGADPQMVLSTMLWRMKDRIVRLEKGGYWMADKPYEAEHYFAEPAMDDMIGSKDDNPPEFFPDGDEDEESPAPSAGKRELERRNYDTPPPPPVDDDLL
jgi:hypothetical protein